MTVKGVNWDPAKHPRRPAGTEAGGEFAPSGYSSAKLEASITKAAKLSSELTDQMISAGRGAERFSDIIGKQDALSLKYLAAANRSLSLAEERNRRMTWHGSTKPIKPKKF